MNKNQQRLKRQKRIRAKISGNAEMPRLSVHRSNKYLTAQIINDQKGVTLAFFKGSDPKVVGAEIAKIAKEKKISKIVFDRGGYRYLGKVKSLAEAAREGGLKF